MSGLLTPDPRLRQLSDLGLVQAGCLLHTYVSGTPSTPLATFNNVDVAAGHENANPIVASAGGLFGPIYLTPGLAYKYVLTDALGNALWSQDPVSVPATYVDGSTIKAADGTVAVPGVTFNSDTDAGLYREGADAIALTTNGVKALGVDSTQFIDSPTQPRCLTYNNAVQSLPNAADTVLTFNTERYDVGALHDPAINPTRLTVPIGGDGLYLVQATYVIAAASGDIRSFLRKNGATELEGTGQRGILNAGFQTTWPMSTLVVLAAGDYVEAIAYQSSGGALNAGDGASAKFMNTLLMVKVW